MLKIGILGSDNSHADRFSELLNLPEHPHFFANADARVVAIWGQEPIRTVQVAEKNHIDQVVEDPAALLDQVDAILCVTRHGGLHFELVRAYLQAHIPTFVDKPLAIDPDDARTIVALAVQSRTPFSSFSTVRFSADTQHFLQQARQLGGVRAGSYSGPATRRNPYGGVLFYAIHSIEMMIMTQGVGVQWVEALEGPAIDAQGNGNLVATCAWKDGMTATIELPVDAQYAFRATALGRTGVYSATLDIQDCYVEGMKQILGVLHGGTTPVPPTEMIEAIQVGAAIELSISEARRVHLYEI